MEVHAHSHTARKKWTHYLWEFLMLFLAVFCGFLAEYQLEHKIEKDREKQYIRSMIADLDENDRILIDFKKRHEDRIQMMDSMIYVMKDPSTIKGNEGSVYYWGRISPRSQTIPLNSRTIDQLKNSGNFRLIHKIETSNQIMDYYEELPLLRQLEGLYQNEFEQYKLNASKIFDPGVFISMEQSDGSVVRTTSNPALQTYDPSAIKQFIVFAVYMNGSGKGIITQIAKLKDKGDSLRSFLKKEYHIK